MMLDSFVVKRMALELAFEGSKSSSPSYTQLVSEVGEKSRSSTEGTLQRLNPWLQAGLVTNAAVHSGEHPLQAAGQMPMHGCQSQPMERGIPGGSGLWSSSPATALVT